MSLFDGVNLKVKRKEKSPICKECKYMVLSDKILKYLYCDHPLTREISNEDVFTKGRKKSRQPFCETVNSHGQCRFYEEKNDD